MPRKLPYQEGDWFAVPLRDGGYGIGLVARMDGKGVVLGYFFGPRREHRPTEDDVAGCSPANAVLIRRFGDLGLIRGDWPIIHRPNTWERTNWPIPSFARIAVDGSWAVRVEYVEASIDQGLREVPISVEEAQHLPEDGLSGYGALEIRLTDVLSV